MNLEFLNVLGKDFKGGKLKLLKSKKLFFFSSEEFLISFDIHEKKMKSFDLGVDSFIITFDIKEHRNFVIIFYENGCVVLFDINTRKIMGKIIFKNQCLRVKWSPVGKLFAGSVANLIQIWTTPFYFSKEKSNFFLTYTLISKCNEIWDFDWNHNGKILIIGGNDDKIRIFYLRNRKRVGINTYIKNSKEIHSIKFCLEGGEFWILTRKNILRKYKLPMKNRSSKIKNNLVGSILSSLFSYKLKKEIGLLTVSKLKTISSSIIQGYTSGILVIFEIPPIPKRKENLSLMNKLSIFLIPYKRFDFFKIEISALSISDDLEFILIGSYTQRKIVVLNKSKPLTLISHKNEHENFTCISISYNDKLVCTGSSNGILKIWSVKLGFVLLFFRNFFKLISKTIFLNKTSRFILSCCTDGTIKLIDLQKLIVVRIMECLKKFNSFEFLDINHSNKLVISSCTVTFKIFIWSLKNGKLKEILDNTNFMIYGLRFIKKRNKIISNNKTGILKIWTLNISWNNPLKINCNTIFINTNISAIAFSPYFNELAVFSNLGQLVILNNNTFTAIGKITCYSKEILRSCDTGFNMFEKTFLEYSGDGRFILLKNNKQNIIVSRNNIKQPYFTKIIKKIDMVEKVIVNYFPNYLKTRSSSEKKGKKNITINIHSFHTSEKWIFQLNNHMTILGLNKNIEKLDKVLYVKVLKEKEKFLLRIIQRFFLYKKYHLLKFLFFYFPSKIKFIIISLLLSNTMVK